MKRLISTLVTFFASLMFVDAQTASKDLRHYIDASFERTLETSTIGVDYTRGYKFNEYIFAGFGLGYHCDIFTDGLKTAFKSDFTPAEGHKDRYEYKDNEYEYSYRLGRSRSHIPVYANARFRMTDTSLTPYIGVSVGIDLSINRILPYGNLAFGLNYLTKTNREYSLGVSLGYPKYYGMANAGSYFENYGNHQITKFVYGFWESYNISWGITTGYAF